ncbi:MAG TPA: HipA domain-containing protein [Kofleriaceae bacterium]
MSGRAAEVLLDEVEVGELVEDDHGYIEFRISERYRAMTRRPVVGQWFEDHRHGVQRGERPGDLPSFFANMIPEGDLRVRIGSRLGVASDDDFAFLCAVGADLPGAIVVHAQGGERPDYTPPPYEDDANDAGWRFSLAGVQLKFSMKRDGNRLTIPGRDDRGNWIVKFAFDSYPELCANEWVTMQWAQRAGFDVPEIELRALRDLEGVLPEADPATPVFVVRRFDRVSGSDSRESARAKRTRVHQEDFQQVVGRQPSKKYDDITYEGVALLAARIVGEDAYDEVLRRLVFVVASGNNDAHMKNWSILYPDGIEAQLSPLYDQVFTAQWPAFSVQMALKLGGTKEFAAVTLARFRELARRLGQSPEVAEAIVTEATEQIVAAWTEIREDPTVTDAYRAALRRHWQKVPLLQPYASRL